MKIKIRNFKRKRLHDKVKDTYYQLHVLEFNAAQLLCKNPAAGPEEEIEDETILLLQKNLIAIMEGNLTDVYATPYNYTGKSTLIDFRGLPHEKDETRPDYFKTEECYPKLPGAIAGAMAYAADLGFTAIAITDEDLDCEENQSPIETVYPGITAYLNKGIREHGAHLEILTEDMTDKKDTGVVNAV